LRGDGTIAAEQSPFDVAHDDRATTEEMEVSSPLVSEGPHP
jgi:hypothetical protein